MKVSCKKCKTRMRISPKDVSAGDENVCCTNCGEIIHVPQEEPWSFSLELQLGEKTVRMRPTKPILTLGRKKTNDLVLRDPRVSRTHSTIAYSGNHFMLFDLSRNGTFVRFDSGEEVLLRKKGTPLLGNGRIGLGRAIPSHLEDVVYFRLIQEDPFGGPVHRS